MADKKVCLVGEAAVDSGGTERMVSRSARADVVPPPPREGGVRCSVAGLKRIAPPLQGGRRLTLRQGAGRHSRLGAGAPIKLYAGLPVLDPAVPMRLHTAPNRSPLVRVTGAVKHLGRSTLDSTCLYIRLTPLISYSMWDKCCFFSLFLL